MVCRNIDVLCFLFKFISNGCVCLVTVFHCSSSDFLAKKHGLYRQQLAKKKNHYACLDLSCAFKQLCDKSSGVVQIKIIIRSLLKLFISNF